jgi:hypothetical protein
MVFQCALEEQVTGGIWGQVILLGVVVQVLSAVSEVKTRHSPSCALANQIQIREIFGQVTANCTEYPIQVTISSHPGAFVAEVPDMLAPGLELDKAQACACSNLDFHNPCV